MNVIRKNIPNAITCLNLVGGLMAIICATKGVEPLWGLLAYQWAFIFIGISAVADFLDGLAARLLGAYSPLGKELDSLCDLVSFGVAPAMLLFFCLQQTADAEWLKWVSFAIPVAGALRLARFNIDDRQTTSFIGMPIPANAIFWIGFINLAYADPGFLPAWYFTLPIILAEAWMMVSNLNLMAFKVKSLAWKGNQARIICVLAALVFILCLGVGGFMWTVVFYVLLSVVDAKMTKK